MFAAATHASFEPWPWQYVAVRFDPRVVAPPPATANRHRWRGATTLGKKLWTSQCFIHSHLPGLQDQRFDVRVVAPAPTNRNWPEGGDIGQQTLHDNEPGCPRPWFWQLRWLRCLGMPGHHWWLFSAMVSEASNLQPHLSHNKKKWLVGFYRGF